MLRFLLHYGIHFLLPFAIGFLFFSKNRFRVILLFLGAMLIDLDHLFASPVFDSNRCSINVHFLHTYWAIGLYFILSLLKRSRLLGLALLLHILADALDCYLMLRSY